MCCGVGNVEMSLILSNVHRNVQTLKQQLQESLTLFIINTFICDLFIGVA